MVSGSIVPYASGVDYLSFTSRTKALREPFEALAISIIDDERLKGVEAKPWRFRDYQGIRCGHVELGTRHNDTLVRISGSLADATWLALYGFADTAARLDLQVTIWDGLAVLPRLQEAYALACERERGPRARPMYDLRQTTVGGGTLYIGTRKSDWLGRAYDTAAKHKEKEYWGSIRFEIEAHDRRALQLSARMACEDWQGPQKAAFVCGWFAARLGSLPNASELLCACRRNDFDSSSGNLPLLHRSVSDSARMLETARVQWRKNARALVDAGMGEQLLECLGLRVSASGELEVC